MFNDSDDYAELPDLQPLGYRNAAPPCKHHHYAAMLLRLAAMP